MWLFILCFLLVLPICNSAKHYVKPSPPEPSYPFANYSAVHHSAIHLIPLQHINLKPWYQMIKNESSLPVKLDSCSPKSNNTNGNSPYVATMLRMPRHYVYTGFKHCYKSAQSSSSTNDERKLFHQWINYYYSQLHSNSNSGSSDTSNDIHNNPLPHCSFQPINPQFHALQQHCILSNQSISSSIDMVEVVAALNQLSYVGIEEFYWTSVCYFFGIIGEFTAMQQCRDNLPLTQSTPSHILPDSMPAEGDMLDGIWSKVDDMANVDLKIYKYAVYRLVENLKLFEFHQQNHQLSQHIQVTPVLMLSLTSFS